MIMTSRCSQKAPSQLIKESISVHQSPVDRILALQPLHQ
jgi:hypothetical protein